MHVYCTVSCVNILNFLVCHIHVISTLTLDEAVLYRLFILGPNIL